MTFTFKNPTAPAAHPDTQATVYCGPFEETPAHEECPGWLQGVYGLLTCGCWCHIRRKQLVIRVWDEAVFDHLYFPPETQEDPEPFCTECGGPFTKEQGGDEQYGGHWDTCPNRPKKKEKEE